MMFDVDKTLVSFAGGLREPIVTLYGGQSIACSPTRYTTGCGNRQRSKFCFALNEINK
jgi:hypothetical protein